MRWGALAVSACLIAGSCGTDESPGPSDAADDATTSGVSAAPTASTTTLRPPPPTDPPVREPVMIGDLEVPCRASAASALPARPGVTDEAIVIGTGTDRGGIATPDAAKGVVEMVEVLADLCNAEGGLLGRDVRVEEYDAAAVEAPDQVGRACAEVSALVGHVFLQAAEAEFAAASCGLPSLPAGSDLVPTSPLGLQGFLVGALGGSPDSDRIVLVGPDTGTAAAGRARQEAAIVFSGQPIQFGGSVAYPIEEVPDWDAIVGTARSTGAGQAYIVGGCRSAVVPFLEAAAVVGWEPIVVATAAAYDPECLDAPRSDALLVELPFLPFEDGDAAPATAAHAVLLEAAGAPMTGSGLLAASSFWRWATAVESCLPDEDRGCFSAFAETQDAWTAGGLHQPIAADHSTEGCAVVLGIEAGAWVRRLPTEPGRYDCTPEWSVPVP